VRTMTYRLVAGWTTLASALVYLDVPLRHAVLVAAMLLLQASLGTAFLIRIIGSGNPSLFLVCGPGLIVGGALSFVAFQLAGRGFTGLAIAAGLGLTGLIHVLPTIRIPRNGATGRVMMVHVAGLTALAMSSEFKWLLAVAAGFFLCGVAITSHRRGASLKSWITLALALVAIVLPPQLRGRWWWLVTDDYMFFQVIADHVTDSGPFADWGFLNFTRYHWLSYGWSGLLDLAAIGPEPLVILTRVMPLAYAAVLGSSLLLITESVARRDPWTPLSFLPAAVLIVMLPLDWTGTSTAGALSVMAALVSMVCVAVDDQSHGLRRILLYVTFGIIAVLTKLPSALMLVPLVIASELTIRSRSRGRPRTSISVAFAVAAAGLIVLLSLPALSNLVGSFTLQWGSQRGDDLREHSLLSSIVIVSGRRSWLFVLVATVWFFYRVRATSAAASNSERMILGLAPLLLVGASFDAIVVGTANTNEYFSHPSYLLAGISVLLFSNSLGGLRNSNSWTRSLLLWGFLAAGAVATGLLLQRVPLPQLPVIAFVRAMLDDPRTIFGILLLAWMIRTSDHKETAVSVPVITMLLLFGLVSVYPSASRTFEQGVRPTPSNIEITSTIGPPDAETIGRWIRRNTSRDDLFGTNYLKNGNDDLGFDYSLAMWSRREFLTYDSFLSFDTTTQVDSSGEIEGFAVSASPESASFLESRGVKWYVVDLATTPRRDWEPYADVAVMTWRLWVLKMR